MLKAKRELADIDSQIQSEIQRIISNLDAQAQVARERTSSIESSVSKSRGKLAGNNRAMVRLNELQRNADAARTLYETLLNRYKETSVEKGVQRTNARIVSDAAVPKAAVDRKSVSLLLGAMIALAFGGGGVILAEALDNAISDGDAVEDELGASYLGAIPLLSSVLDASEQAPGGPEAYVIDRPLSSFTEAVRNLNASVLFSRIGYPSEVIAITSSLPGEGKTTTAVCLARTLALSGKKVVLVDCDLRQRAVMRILAEEPKVGLVELLNGDAPLDSVLVDDTVSSAKIIPLSNNSFTPKDLFGSPAMKSFIQDLRDRFDVIVLDTAPVLLVTETRTVVNLADVCVLLVRWRKTTKRAVSTSLKLINSSGATLAGVALTQVDLSKTLNLSDSDPSSYYNAYKKYYQS
jgi:polysaccharide biosynthesis transport protein